MNAVTRREPETRISVGINDLQIMLGVGKNTAAQIGKAAGAELHIGRRKLYNVEKVKAYIDSLG